MIDLNKYVNKLVFALLVVLTFPIWGHAAQIDDEKIIVLTFDDAVKSHRTFVGPLLKELGFGATFFITQCWMSDTTNFMNWQDVADLYKMGFEIGNHTWSHLPVDKPEQAGRLQGELEKIEQQLQKQGIPRPVSFAYPGNNFGPEAVQVLRKNGYKFARRGMQPEIPYGKMKLGPLFDPTKHNPLLIPTSADAYPEWTLDYFKTVVDRAQKGKAVILQFHGVPDIAHPWVHTDPEKFKSFMYYLKENHFNVIALKDLASYFPMDDIDDPLLNYRYPAPKPVETGKAPQPGRQIERVTGEISISADRSTVAMGRSVVVAAKFQPADGEARDYILLPFVNQRRWGSHERPDMNGNAIFLLPLPNPGPAHIEIVAIPSDTNHWMGLKNQDVLMAGHPMISEGIHSNVLKLSVMRREFSPKTSAALFGMQWEPWFTSGAKGWRTAHAVPVIGFYDSYNRDALRQHVLWFMDVGVDFILPDWSNHIWACKHWDERKPHTNMILHATQLLLETLAEMREEGLPVPKVALMPGLSNGQPATMPALNEELQWIYRNYLRNPRFDGLWQQFEGKPLIVILDTGAMAHPGARTEASFRIPFFKQTLGGNAEHLDSLRANEKTKVDDSHFTVRWMSSQNQTTGHDKFGYWTWMDGITDYPVTYRNGVAEAATISTAFFNALGWTGPGAHGRRGGATFAETFNVALKHRPKVILLHQFNEFAGQPPGHGLGPNKDIYLDSYSVELSDDIEPVSMTAAGFRGDHGGWGFYFLNLTRALLDIYNGQANDCTVLTVANPLRNAVVTEPKITVEWVVTGKKPDKFSIEIDGQTVKRNLTGTSTEISIAQLGKGAHILTCKVDGAVTRYPLSFTELDIPLINPIPVQVDVPFEIRKVGWMENLKIQG